MTDPQSPESTDIEVAAARLAHATLTGVPCAPVRDVIPRDDVTRAYAVQRHDVASRIRSGRRVVGRKIGLTSPAVQAQLGVDQPDFGVLLDDMAHASGAELYIGHFLQPRVEAEVAFVLGHDLDHGPLDLDQIRAAVTHVQAAIEVCDSRIAGWDITFADTVADNASAGAFVLGTDRLTLDEVNPRDVEMTMTVAGQVDSSGTGEACLGDPLLALRWLARHARDLGEPLRADQIILSGALGPMRPALPGATVSATISGLGTVSCSFTMEEE